MWKSTLIHHRAFEAYTATIAEENVSCLSTGELKALNLCTVVYTSYILYE